jgi:GTPase
MIAHLISLESEDVVADYRAIRRELETYDEELGKKEEIIILTKTDVTDEKSIAQATKALATFNKPIFAISVIDDVSLKYFGDALVKLLRGKEGSTGDIL